MDPLTHEFICDDGRVLKPDEVEYIPLEPSPTGSMSVDVAKSVHETYMVPKRRDEEDENFYRLVRSQARLKYDKRNRPSIVFGEIAKIASSNFAIPVDVIETARKLFFAAVKERKLLTTKIIERYAIAAIFYAAKKRGLPISLLEFIKLFSRKRGGDIGFSEAYWDIQKIAGPVSQDYTPFLIKLSSIAKLDGASNVLELASKIAGEMKKLKPIKPNVAALASFIAACERSGVKLGVSKSKLAKAVGVSSYDGALKLAKKIALAI
jgi:transcription initiation factor TFIIIB Brf1 subunit/transcription initiation factor TFIIB